MPSPTVDVATGYTRVFGTSGFTMELLDCEFTGFMRESFETSHQGTAIWKTFKPKRLTDPGGLNAKFHYNPSTVPPVTNAAAAETITVTFPNGTTKIACSGFMTNFVASGTLEEKMVGTATIKFSGVPTFTAG